jgi:chromosome segregation ATPase
MRKTCILCATEFDTKRSDANYCSEQCRAKANYQIRKKKNNLSVLPDNSTPISPHNSPDNSGRNMQKLPKIDLSKDEIMQKIVLCEHEINQINTQKSAILAQNTQLHAQILKINEKINQLNEVKLKGLQLALLQTDVHLYNKYLNSEYKNAVKNGDSFAHTKLKTEEDLNFRSAYDLRHKITALRHKIENKILSYKADAIKLQSELDTCNQQLSEKKDLLKDLNEQLRFIQMRIIRHEQLLTG